MWRHHRLRSEQKHLQWRRAGVQHQAIEKMKKHDVRETSSVKQ